MAGGDIFTADKKDERLREEGKLVDSVRWEESGEWLRDKAAERFKACWVLHRASLACNRTTPTRTVAAQ